jgi:hypothetical protein
VTDDLLDRLSLRVECGSERRRGMQRQAAVDRDGDEDFAKLTALAGPAAELDQILPLQRVPLVEAIETGWQRCDPHFLGGNPLLRPVHLGEAQLRIPASER